MTLDLTNETEKIVAFRKFIMSARNDLGGMINSILIPPDFIEYMSNVSLEPKLDAPFYLYGWYEQFRFTIYIDETLKDNFYLICNRKNIKVNVIR